MPLPIAAVFADLPDPRIETANKLHTLIDILTIAVRAVIGGADGWGRSPSTGGGRRRSSAGS